VNSRVNSCIGIHHVLRTRRAPADIGATTAEKLEGTLHSHGGRNWVHKKIPGCAVELNTQNCAWFGIQISLVTAISFRGAVPPRTSPWTLLGDFRSPDPLCPHLQILATPLTGPHVWWIPIPLLFLRRPFPVSRCFTHSLSYSSFRLPLNLASWSGEAP